MTVRHPQPNLIAYLRGELREGEQSSMEAHLPQCVECRAEIVALRQGLELIAQGIDELPTPDWNDYRTELRRKLIARRNPQTHWWQLNLFWGSLAAAGIAALLLVSLPTLHRGVNGPSSAGSSPMMDQLAMEDVMSHTDVGLLRDYPVVERLDMLENYDVIEHLDELSPAPPQTNATTHQL